MKLILLLVASASVFSLVMCEFGNDIYSIRGYLAKQELSQSIDKIDSICPGYADKLLEALQKARSCLERSEDTTICSNMKDNFMSCSKPVISVLKDCLPEKSVEVPEFVFDSVLRASKYLCKTDGEHIFELQNPCLYQVTYKTRRCLRRIETKLEEYNSEKPSKAGVCSALQSLKGCFQSHILSACGNKITQESFLGFYAAVTAGCETANVRLIKDEVETF